MKYKIYYLFLLVLLAVCLYFVYRIEIKNRSLQVVFLDVGQGDSILIQKGTRQVLIDGGPSGKTELAKLGKYMPYFDREIELVVATHPDRDHIAGLVDVARNYKIVKVMATGAEKDTSVFKEWKEILSYKKVEVLDTAKGSEIDTDGAKLKIIYPLGPVESSAGDSNNKSIVARMDFGRSAFLFTGDIESPAEKEILASDENIDVDFLKVAHHGSKYSSSDEFLEAASPNEAIISVGAENSYGHPHEETLEKLHSRNIKVWRTDEVGDVVYTCRDQKCQQQD